VKTSYKSILVFLTEAQVRALDRISEQTGRSRSELIREATTILITEYMRILEEGKCQSERNPPAG